MNRLIDRREFSPLKSDQNGIEILFRGQFSEIILRLKSDQNGIEMNDIIQIFDVVFLLKSDQNGIEIDLAGKLRDRENQVKIRPKWD